MSYRQQPGAFQNSNYEWKKCLDDLCNKRNSLQHQIKVDQELYDKLLIQFRKLNHKIDKNVVLLNNTKKTIQDAESAFKTHLDNSKYWIDLLESAK